MSIIRIAHRYAESLFEIAQKAQILDAVYKDIKYLEALAKTDELRPFLKSPLFKVAQKQAVFAALLKDKAQQATIQTVQVICAHKRESYLVDICTEFEEMYLKATEVSRAILITAAPITEARAQEIVREFQIDGLLDKEVRLEQRVDANIMGGFVLYFRDQVYDASVAYKVGQLHKQFSENLYTKTF